MICVLTGRYILASPRPNFYSKITKYLNNLILKVSHFPYTIVQLWTKVGTFGIIKFGLADGPAVQVVKQV